MELKEVCLLTITLKEKVELLEKEFKEFKAQSEITPLSCPSEEKFTDKLDDLNDKIKELNKKVNELENDLINLSTDCIRKDGLPKIIKEICKIIEDELGVRTTDIQKKLNEF